MNSSFRISSLSFCLLDSPPSYPCSKSEWVLLVLLIVLFARILSSCENILRTVDAGYFVPCGRLWPPPVRRIIFNFNIFRNGSHRSNMVHRIDRPEGGSQNHLQGTMTPTLTVVLISYLKKAESKGYSAVTKIYVLDTFTL